MPKLRGGGGVRCTAAARRDNDRGAGSCFKLSKRVESQLATQWLQMAKSRQKYVHLMSFHEYFKRTSTDLHYFSFRFIFKIRQTAAVMSVISQFDKFFESNFLRVFCTLFKLCAIAARPPTPCAAGPCGCGAALTPAEKFLDQARTGTNRDEINNFPSHTKYSHFFLSEISEQLAR